MVDALQIDVTGIAELNALFDNITDIIDPERVLDEAAAILLNRIRTRFLEQVDADGNPWPVSAASRIRNSTPGGGGGTLFDTGALFNSLQVFTNEPGVRGLGTDIPYAPQHQFGENGLPERNFLGFNDDDGLIIERLIADRIERARP